MTPSDLVLSFYPSPRGFGFVLFEGPLSPFDWGVTRVRGPIKNRLIVKKVEAMIDRYQPVTLVLEDWSDDWSRRNPRIRELYRDLVALARRKGIPVVRYSMRKVREFFARRNALSRHDIAEYVARMIPAFSYQVPPKRRTWDSEDIRQSLYDAAALGLTYFGSEYRD
jgi:hypothetical protein